jgi:hypothetical protein
MNIKNIIFYFSLMMITTIIYKHYTNLFMLELNIKNTLTSLFLGFITSKLADNIYNNININYI